MRHKCVAMIPRLLAAVVLALAPASGQDIGLFHEYGGGPEQTSELASDGLAHYMTGGALPSYSTIPGIGTSGFLRKADTAGNELWVQRFPRSTLVLRRYGVAAYGSAIYVGGYTGGDSSTRVGAKAFLRKYDAAGTELWTREFGSHRDTAACGVAAHSTGVYIAGEVGALNPAADPLASAGTFVRKYEDAGQLHWTRQITTPGAYGPAGGIAVDKDRVYGSHPS